MQTMINNEIKNITTGVYSNEEIINATKDLKSYANFLLMNKKSNKEEKKNNRFFKLIK